VVSTEVRKATEDESQALARTLGRAFQSDPVFGWLIPDPARREALLAPTFGLFLRRLWLRHEETYTVDGASGVAAWNPPGTWHAGPVDQLRLLPAMLRVWGRLSPRGLRALTALERGHPSDRHHYLAFMGVEPESQGRGLGSKLLFPVLSRCDGNGTPAYLEASAPRNRGLYERHGFEVTEEIRLGRGAPPVWRMWRQAP
jgi:GNAT superfamily N-acetyltransferase